MPPAQWTTTRFSNGCATTGFDCFEGSRQAARLFFNYSVIIFVPSRGLTQTVTQKQRGQESTGEGRMASSVPLRLFCGLHGLADDAADGVGGGALHSLRGVGVGAEGKARVIVSQRAGQRLDIHAVLEGQRGEGVPLRYNNDKQKKPLFSRGLSVCRLLFNSFSKLKIDENYKEKRRLFY